MYRFLVNERYCRAEEVYLDNRDPLQAAEWYAENCYSPCCDECDGCGYQKFVHVEVEYLRDGQTIKEEFEVEIYWRPVATARRPEPKPPVEYDCHGPCLVLDAGVLYANVDLGSLRDSTYLYGSGNGIEINGL